MATPLHITTPIPGWLETAVSRRLITRKVANELCDWAYHQGVLYQGIAEQRVYYRAVAGETTEAVEAFAGILRSITNRAQRHEKTSWGEPMATIWRKRFGATLLFDIRAELINSVLTYLPDLLAAGEQPDDDKELLNQILSIYK